MRYYIFIWIIAVALAWMQRDFRNAADDVLADHEKRIQILEEQK